MIDRAFTPDGERPSTSAPPTPGLSSTYTPGSELYVDAWDRYLANYRPPRARGHTVRIIRELVVTAILAALIFFGSRAVVQGRQVLGPSMAPTYHTGQRLFVVRYFFDDPSAGDVVVFHPPVPSKDDYIKRVIAVPGDHVLIRDGRVIVNGRPLAEPYLNGIATPCSGRWCDITLDKDQYFVMGDNRSVSSDSRYWGPVTSDRIVGHAWLLYYPLSDFGLVP